MKDTILFLLKAFGWLKNGVLRAPTGSSDQ